MILLDFINEYKEEHTLFSLKKNTPYWKKFTTGLTGNEQFCDPLLES